MRRLLLFRHAEAEKSEPGTPDRARALTERGKKDATTIGAFIAGHALIADHVIVSAALRAQQTWNFAATNIRPAPTALTLERLYSATPQAILTIIKEAPAMAHSLMVVGHNPGLHEVALMLIASGDIEMRERLREQLPAAGLVVVDFPSDVWAKLHPQSGRLERFVSPRTLETAAN